MINSGTVGVVSARPLERTGNIARVAGLGSGAAETRVAVAVCQTRDSLDVSPSVLAGPARR
jgi:hypothetical protein